jgi:hypothetical protein
MTSKSIQEVQDLIGEEISAISFVRDYVEIHFDGPVLRSLSGPTVVESGIRYAFPESGSRDALCRLIGSTVCALTVDDATALILTTDDGCVVMIPLDDQHRQWPEAMHFVVRPNGPMQVW